MKDEGEDVSLLTVSCLSVAELSTVGKSTVTCGTIVTIYSFFLSLSKMDSHMLDTIKERSSMNITFIFYSVLIQKVIKFFME